MSPLDEKLLVQLDKRGTENVHDFILEVFKPVSALIILSLLFCCLLSTCVIAVSYLGGGNTNKQDLSPVTLTEEPGSTPLLREIESR